MTDTLTGLPTHKDGLQEALIRHRASVCLVDIDGLIWVTDQHGHAEADRVLSLVANHLRAGAADHAGSVFRVGGDEFLVILPGLDLAAALQAATRIVSGVHSLQIPYRRPDRPQRTILEVNVAVLHASDALAGWAFSQSGLTSPAREWLGKRMYREKLRVGCEAGVVLDLSSEEDYPWAG